MKVTIKEVRSKFGLTQKQMARIMGMAQPTLARIESGKRTETKVHMANLLALDLLYANSLLDEFVRICAVR